MGGMLSAPARPTKSSFREDPCGICRKLRAKQGEHRAVCLPCGHGFGYSCIVRRLRSGAARCPQCGARAAISLLRPAARCRPTAEDGDTAAESDETSRERDEARRERAERRRLEKELVDTRQRLQKKDNVVKMLQAELRKLQRRVRMEESDYDVDSAHDTTE